MRQFHLPTALLPEGWADDVLVSRAAAGRILSVAPGVPCESRLIWTPPRA